MNLKVISGLFTLVLLMIIGCVSEFNAVLPSSDVQILFVDGNIVENSDMTFYISKSFPINSIGIPQESLDINANIKIIGSNGYESPSAVNLGKGTYMISSIGELDDNVEYGLKIEYDGDVFQSTLSKPLHTPEIDSVSWIQPDNNSDVYFRVSTHDETGQARFFIWNYVEDWELTSSYYTTVFYEPVRNEYYTIDPAPYYYCWKNHSSDKYLIGATESLSENKIINKKLYNRKVDNDRFCLLYSVIVYQKAISKSAFEYYQNKIVVNDEMGGLFTPQPSELTGNIICITDPSRKVMGYIEPVKNITHKRIFINSSDVTGPRFFNCEIFDLVTVAAYLNERELTYPQYYYSGFRPAGSLDTITGFPHVWTTDRCTDCVINGGSKNKPEFWPNQHE